MHAKFLALLAVSPLALGQDWYDDAMDALASQTESGGAIPTGDNSLDQYLDDSDYLDDIDTTNDFGSDSDDSSSSDDSFDFGSDDSSSSSSADDSSDSNLGPLTDIPSSILSQIQTALPPSVFQELATPASLSSLYSEVQEGHLPSWATDLPPDVRDYLESAWDVDVPAGPTGGSNSQGGDDEQSSSGSDNEGADGDAAGMISPSVLASMLGAVGVLGVALAL
ncbi:uncharacterized protein BJX67DRAFT_167207 [Aspergillus lucknowensis]|uniref:GPI anchored protein n=1 Tax=Aspergillus lucknowensis TaxID=176173 RepID=A0ABR4M533_9EURO